MKDRKIEISVFVNARLNECFSKEETVAPKQH